MRDESSPFVQQQLVLTLSVAADETADLAMAAMVRQNPGTEYLADAAVSGLSGRELPLLQKLLAAPEWTLPDEKAHAFLSALARCIFTSREPSRVESLLGLIARKGTQALIEGVLQTKPVTKRKPVKLKSEPAALRDAKGLEAINDLITWPGKPGAKPEPPVIPLTAAQQQRFDLGRALFTGICAACHQPHGMGMEGVAPPLVDSEWVLGSEQRLVRILLHGISGPLSVKGRSYRLDMPPLGVFTDDQVAGILTYIRREWEHNAPPVEPDLLSRKP
jgi:mono/diheme cytochrome c family protein